MPDECDARSTGDELVIRGRFERADGIPIVGAAVHERFLGEPPVNLGTSFDLEVAPAITDRNGDFCLTLSKLDEKLSQQGPAGTWKRGCFLVLAVKDSRTIGFAIASGDELSCSPITLTSLSAVDIQGYVVDEHGLPVVGAMVEVARFLFFVGRGAYASAPVNFWLSKSRKPLADLITSTGAEGHFVISRAPAMPGEVHLTVSHPGFANLDATYYPFQPTMRLVMKAGALVRLRVALPDEEPAVGFEFYLEGVPDAGTRCIHRLAVTDAAGRCEFGALPIGSYTVRYVGGGGETWAVPAVAVSGLSGPEQREIAVRAVRGSILRGRVYDGQSRTPIRLADVRFESEAYPATASTFQATNTDAAGAFSFGFAVAPGPLQVRVSALHHGELVSERHDINVGQDPCTELDLTVQLHR